MEKSFTIEKIENGYIGEVNGIKRHFAKIGSLLNETFKFSDNLFVKKSKIKITIITDEIDA